MMIASNDNSKKMKFKIVRHALADMGKQALAAVDMAVQAIQAQSGHSESDLKKIETRLDSMEEDVEKVVLDYMDSRRPKGKKLRFCTVSMKVASDYERIGDRSLEMVKRLIRISDYDSIRIPRSLEKMAGMMKMMVQFATEAIDNRDLALAEKILHDYSRLVEMYKSVNEELNQNGFKDNQAAIQLMLIARHMDRVCQVARAIAENVEFVVIGEMPDDDADD